MRLTLSSVVILGMLTAAIPVHAQQQRLKLRCIAKQKTLTLWENPHSACERGDCTATKEVGTVKCGTKVTVLGSELSGYAWTYLLIKTGDKIGYVRADMLDSAQRHSWRDAVQAAATAMDAYARTSDPHIAWCDNHGGFQERTTDRETVNITDTNTGTPLGTGTISHTYIVCKDGTRIKEQ